MYLVSILGESAGVITEALEWLRNNEKDKHIVSIVLYSKNVKEEVEVLRKVLKDKRVKERIGDVEMKFRNIGIEDIENEKDLKKFEKVVEKILKDIGKNEKIVVNVSGGRKMMVILLMNLIKGRNFSWLNIISYLPRERIAELGSIIREKLDSGIKLEDEEINDYFFSGGKYKVFYFSR